MFMRVALTVDRIAVVTIESMVVPPSSLQPHVIGCSQQALGQSSFLMWSSVNLPSVAAEYKIIIVGLDNAGKTTILYQL